MPLSSKTPLLDNSVPEFNIKLIALFFMIRSVWKQFPEVLGKHFWKERTFWTDGYFVSTTGQASEETIRKYIENQG
jgi:REP element-mobilizing transposase RayT